jgi:hypothetical protein
MATKDPGGSSDDNATEDERRFMAEHGDELSRSTKHARWIHGPDDRPERPGQTLASRSCDVIRAWAEERGARPAVATRGEDGRPRVLRLAFTEEGSDRLEEVSWDEWCRTFEERDLVFLYQEEKRDGTQSNFFRLDSPEREDG